MIKKFCNVAFVALISLIFCWLFLFSFPPIWVWNLISSADSLLLLDIANDLWSGKSLTNWNFPRAPYIFPDLFIASAVMLLGWRDDLTLLLIAFINYLFFVFVGFLLVKEVLGGSQKFLKIVSFLSLAVILFAVVIFPKSFPLIFWQIFASGAHFSTAIMVLLIIYLAESKSKKKSKNYLLVVILLAFLAALSNSMTLLLLGSWLVFRLIFRLFLKIDRNYSKSNILFEVSIFIAIIIGVLLGSLIPKQSIANSFVSKKLLTEALQRYKDWLFGDISNFLLMFSLLMFSFLWAIISYSYADRKCFLMPKTFKNWIGVAQNPYLAPSISLFFIAPFFFENPASLRYYAFSGFIAIVFLTFVLIRFWDEVIKESSFKWLISISLLAGCSFLIFQDNNPPSFSSKEKRSELLQPILGCFDKAELQYELRDGIATYWYARPIRFASNFKYFLAQTRPWHPEGGYYVWGNNAEDFIYKDKNRVHRRYNFIFASDDELKAGMWGGVLQKSSNVINCDFYKIFIFEDEAVLSNFLFVNGALKLAN